MRHLLTSAILSCTIIALEGYIYAWSGELPVIPLPDQYQIAGITPSRPLPVTSFTPGGRIQNVSYTVIDSLFNAFSYYGSNQTSVLWDPKTKVFVTIKRGALPPNTPGTNDHGNSVFILYTTNSGVSWQRIGPVMQGFRGELSIGAPRYPAIAMLYDSPTQPSLENCAFAYYSPITDGNQWVGIASGYIPNQVGSSPNNLFVPQFIKNGDNYSFGTTINTTSLTTGPDSIFAFGFTSLFPAQAGSVPTSENNNLVLIRTDVYGLEQFTPYIPPSLSSQNFADPGNPQSRTSSEIAIDIDANGALYAGIFGRIAVGNADPSRVTFAVSKSTDNGMTWSSLNVLPLSVLEAYMRAYGGDPSQLGFGFSWAWGGTTNTRVTSMKDFVVTGPDKYSFAAELLLVQGQEIVDVHYVEVFYENGQWGIRKIANASLFETNSQWAFDNGGELNPSQLGCELQLSRTEDYSVVLFKTLEARLLDWSGQRLLTTDIVVSARPTSGSQWEPLRNVTQSIMLDRITWLPKVIPATLENIPLLTVQAAYRGNSDREYYWDNQFLLASSSQNPPPDEVLRYRQYVTYSLFDYEGLPLWDATLPVESANVPFDISVTPIPTASTMTILISHVMNQSVTIELVDLLGKVVHRATTLSNEQAFHTIDVSTLPVGTYRCLVRVGTLHKSIPVQVLR